MATNDVWKVETLLNTKDFNVVTQKKYSFLLLNTIQKIDIG